MGFFNMFDKLDDIVFEPIKVVTDWAREPLKRWEDERDTKKSLLFKKVENEALKEAEEKEFEREIRRKETDANLIIRKETEIQRIIMEIDELAKDKELARMKSTTEAIISYKERLTSVNMGAIDAIGNMQLDLRKKAQALVYEKTIAYKELQDRAFHEAADDLKRIEKEFGDNSIAQEILIKAVDMRLTNIINTANSFLQELASDITLINRSITLLTEHGQGIIERHLEKFHFIDNRDSEIKRIEDLS